MVNNKNTFFSILFLILAIQVIAQMKTEKIRIKAPFKMPAIEVPDFSGAKVYNIVDFGAVNDSLINSGTALKKAIENCAENGGGIVFVPAGKFLTGPLYLKSNVNLHLEKGATLLFSTHPADYLPLVQTRWEGIDVMNYSPLVYAFNEKNIAITGEGTLDGQAANENWWAWKGRRDHGWKPGTPNQTDADKRPALFAMAEKDIPVSERIFGEGFYLRPQFVQPYGCSNVRIEGVTILNSPMWIIHPVLCTNVVVRNVKVISEGPNSDGCDPESCKNVLIENCYFKTGDDCIALKSGRNRDGRRIGIPCENVVVRNCSMQNGHAGIGIGSEIGGGVKNIFFENCRISDCMWAIRFKTSSARGGVNSNVIIRNIKAEGITNQAICVTMMYEDKGDFIPTISDVLMKNIRVDGGKEGIVLEGYPGSPMTNLMLENVKITGVKKAKRIVDAGKPIFKNTFVNGEKIAL